MQYVFETTVIANDFEEAYKLAVKRRVRGGFPSRLNWYDDLAKVSSSSVLLIGGSVYTTSFDFTFRAND